LKEISNSCSTGGIRRVTAITTRASSDAGNLFWFISIYDIDAYLMNSLKIPKGKSESFRSFPHSWLITGFVTRLTRRVPLVEQELLTLPEHLSSPPVFSGVRITRYLVLCVCFVDRCLSLYLTCWKCSSKFIDIKGYPYGDVKQRKKLRQRLQCKSFQWYIENLHVLLSNIRGRSMTQWYEWLVVV
jgi:hypothetical protein